VRPLIDEQLALRAASLTAPRRRATSEQAAALRADVLADLPAIDAAAREWSQLGTDLPPTTGRVVGRTAWVRANISSLQGAFEPVRERLERRGPGATRFLAIQLGALFGLLSAKVLGQYVLPLGGPGGGQLLIVGPNVLDLADEHGPLARDIRRTVVLHEVTHRLQFDGTPWLGDHLRGLLDRYLAGARVDALPVADLVRDLPDAVAAVKEGDIRPLLQTVLTDEQAVVIDEAQGLMSLLEGHGTTAMYEAAIDELIDDPEAVRDALASRRNDVTSKVLTAVAGMEMKRRQYREGEAFVREVIEVGGVETLNLAFRSATDLPAADEVGDPTGWIARVRAA
jgi:coenzyme F420 biosynthesis associated uncharacterized protein